MTFAILYIALLVAMVYYGLSDFENTKRFIRKNYRVKR